MKKMISEFSAFGYDFQVVFPLEDGAEYIEKISRPRDGGGPEIVIEEGSDLEEELISALKKHKGYISFVDDTFNDLQSPDYDEPDWYCDEDVGDALSARDDEMGQ